MPCSCESFTRFALALLLAAFAPAATAQFPAPLASPDVELTEPTFTRALARLPDGKLVVAGLYLRVNGQQRSFVARLLPDGSLDTSWNPAPNNAVTGLYVDALGRLYVGGSFSRIAGQARTRVARFAPDGTLDTAWTVSANNAVNAFAPGLPGEICLGGLFTTINTVARGRLACVSELDGALNSDWNPNANATVLVLLAANGALYAGGTFTQVGATTRNRAARIALAGTGTLDAWNPAPNDTVNALLEAGPSQLYIAGGFSLVGAIARRAVARVDATTGAVDANWSPNGGTDNALVLGLVPDGAGGVYAAGSFLTLGGQARRNIARLSGTNGSAVAGWDPGLEFGYATRLAAEPGGDVVVAGPFAAAGNGEHLGIARVFASGVVDPQFGAALESSGSALTLARVPGDGALIVGGSFARANGTIRRRLARVDTAGNVDPNWAPQVDGQVRSIAADALGRVYISGSFTRVNGVARSGLARLLATADGALDPGWIPATFGFVSRILLRPEGLYVGNPGGTIPWLARFSTGPAATVDSGWNPQLDNSVFEIVPTLDGSLIVTGTFANAGGLPRAGIARIGTGASAVVDPLWAPQIVLDESGPISAAEYDNSMFLSGPFSSVNGVPRSRLAKISAVGSGALDTTWAPSLTAAEGYGLRLAADAEHVYVAGNAGGGFFRPFLARYGREDGVRDPTWRPRPDGGLFDLLIENTRVCVVGFVLQTLGGQTRRGFGCLPKTGVNAIFADGFED